MHKMLPRGPDWLSITAASDPTDNLWGPPINAPRSGRSTSRPPGPGCSIRTPCHPRWIRAGKINSITIRAAILSPILHQIFSKRPWGRIAGLPTPVLRGSVSYVKGVHNIKAGVLYEHTFLTERDTFGIVDPTFNSVCLNADGSPNTEAGLTDPSRCVGSLQPNPDFVPQLGCIDLTRTGSLPGSSGCPNSNSAAVPLPRPRGYQGTGAVHPGHHHQEQLDLQHRAARRCVPRHHE